MANIDVTITDNSDIFLNALPEQIEQALKAIGLTAESYAKDICPVDTGRLRNSITHAVDVNEKSAYIGSNVEYAAIVELGSSKQRAQPYLTPAATQHSDEYKALAEQALKNA